jgi:hypothetical protein
MIDHELDRLPKFLRVLLFSHRGFSQKSSTYNNLVAMAATAVCNYSDTNGFTRRGHGPQSVFMNGRVHHYMRIASTTSHNCGISYFVFDDIAALAGSADRQNVDPTILSDICHGLKYENSYCRNLRFLGVEAHRHTSTPAHRHSGITAHTGTHWHTLAHRHTGTLADQHTGRPAHLIQHTIILFQ